MAGNSIFGPHLSLPELPGLHSSCEKELLMLLKEIDLAIEQKCSKVCKELEETTVLCLVQKNEIESLRSTMKSRNKEFEDLKSRYEGEGSRYLKQIDSLKAENENLTEKYNSMFLNDKTSLDEKSQVQSLKKSNDRLKKEVKDLKEHLWKKDQQQLHLEDSYQKLLSVLSILQKEVNEKEKLIEITLKATDLRGVDSHVSSIAEKLLAEESSQQKNLDSEIMMEIEALEEWFKSSAFQNSVK